MSEHAECPNTPIPPARPQVAAPQRRRITLRPCTRNAVPHDVLHDLRHRRARRRLPGVRHQGFQGTYRMRVVRATHGGTMDALDGCDVARVWRVRARGSGVDRARVERDRGCDARMGNILFF